MDVFEYIDRKKNEYEKLNDESQLQYKTNLNLIEKLTVQLQELVEQGEDPSQIFAPTNAVMLERDMEEIKEKISTLQLRNEVLEEQIRLCRVELDMLDELELPNIGTVSDEFNIASAQENENVSRETFQMESIDTIKEKLLFCKHIVQLDPQRCRLCIEEILDEME